MAKSIYEILATGETTTSVPGYGTEVPHTIPEELFPTDEEFESEEKLLEWATEIGCLHACLQKGVQKFLIEVRAAFKSHKKDEVWTPKLGQTNVDSMEWKVTNRPNQSGGKAIAQAKLAAGLEMAKAMRVTGLDDDTILASITPVYGEAEAKSIMEQLD